MLDARLDDVLCRIDTITNRLAASNSGQGAPLSAHDELALLRELHHLNTRLAVRFAAMSGIAARTPWLLTKVLGAAGAGAVLLTIVIFMGMMLSTILHDLAMSFALMARPVP